MDQGLDRKIKAVTFDGDETLWEFQSVMRRALQHTLARLQERLPGPESAALTVDQMIEIRDQVADELADRTMNLEEIRRQAFARTVELVGGAPDGLAARLSDRPANYRVDQLAGELSAVYLEHRFSNIDLYPEVPEVLDALAPSFTLGVLSNGNTSPERCGLAGRFAFVIFAQDVGIRKPHPDIFLETCRRAGCEPQELMHVGDSLTSDVQGANNVGAVSVWINREGAPNTTLGVPNTTLSAPNTTLGVPNTTLGVPNTTEIVPDFEIRSLRELIPILRSTW